MMPKKRTEKGPNSENSFNDRLDETNYHIHFLRYQVLNTKIESHEYDFHVFSVSFSIIYVVFLFVLCLFISRI